MSRSRGPGPGFAEKPTSVASSGLTHAVAASLAIALSLCLMMTFTLLTINTHLPLPA
jgi:threonine/homoserine/homoserine lactone efflux protein